MHAGVSNLDRNTQRRGVASSRRGLLLLAAFLIWFTTAEFLIGGSSTLVVTSLDDGGPGSLRQHVATARAGETISFAVSGTIVLTNGPLVIGRSLNIAGPGASDLAISAGGRSRVFEVLPGTSVRISGLTICDGRAEEGTAGTLDSPVGGKGRDGGGIHNAGSLTIGECVISNCVAGNGGAGFITGEFRTLEATNWIGGVGGRGGAIYNAGQLEVRNSRFVANSSGAGGDGGGAIERGAAGRSGGDGGAIYNVGMMRLTGSVFDQNAAGNGGAAYWLRGLALLPGGQPGGAGGHGGAICDFSEAVTSIVDCHFSFNSSGAAGMGSTRVLNTPDFGGDGGTGGSGGAVFARNPVRVIGSSFVSNKTGRGAQGGEGVVNGGRGGAGGSGAAIYAISDLILTSSSCLSNSAASGGDGGLAARALGGAGGNGGSGGAVYGRGSMRLSECIFIGNSAGDGGKGGENPNPTEFPYGVGNGGGGGLGGALYCHSDLAATNCTFNGNYAGDGGPPARGGTTLSFGMLSSTGGSSGGKGGGLFGGGSVTLHACTLNGNQGGNGTSAERIGFKLIDELEPAVPGAKEDFTPGFHPNRIIVTKWGGGGGPGGAGGIHSENSLKLVLCTLSGNVGGSGGHGGQSYAYQEYRAGGSGGSGGAGAVSHQSSNELMLIACTIAGNRGGPGGMGGLGQSVPDGSGRTGQGTGGAGGTGGVLHANSVSASLVNTIVAANFDGPAGPGGPFPASLGDPGGSDVHGPFQSSGHNLIGRTNGSSGFTNGVNGDIAGWGSVPVDPVLGPLADNGGATFTMALLHGSPALNSGDNALLGSPHFLRKDQRGFPRKSGPRVDIGAFEFQPRRGGVQPSASELFVSGTLTWDGNLQTGQELNSDTRLDSPGFQITFSDPTPGATYTVLASTNLLLPLNEWNVLGQPVQVAPGQFRFFDTGATNTAQRFYRVSSP